MTYNLNDPAYEVPATSRAPWANALAFDDSLFFTMGETQQAFVRPSDGYLSAVQDVSKGRAANPFPNAVEGKYAAKQVTLANGSKAIDFASKQAGSNGFLLPVELFDGQEAITISGCWSQPVAETTQNRDIFSISQLGMSEAGHLLVQYRPSGNSVGLGFKVYDPVTQAYSPMVNPTQSNGTGAINGVNIIHATFHCPTGTCTLYRGAGARSSATTTLTGPVTRFREDEGFVCRFGGRAHLTGNDYQFSGRVFSWLVQPGLLYHDDGGDGQAMWDYTRDVQNHASVV